MSDYSQIISADSVRRVLASIRAGDRRGRLMLDGPLLQLERVTRSLSASNRPDTLHNRSDVLRAYLEAIIWSHIIACDPQRTITDPHQAVNRELELLISDFSTGKIELQAWSWLNYRFMVFDPERVEVVASKLNFTAKTLQRRLDVGLSALVRQLRLDQVQSERAPTAVVPEAPTSGTIEAEAQSPGPTTPGPALAGVAALSALPLPRSLPVPLTTLVGRGVESAELESLLRRTEVRLVTISGPGGVGKTRLALHVGDALLDAYRDGVPFVDLSPLRNPALVLSTIASVLGVRAPAGQGLDRALREFLSSKRMLLVLDNFEQVVDAGPELTGLLRHCPGVDVLVTSREVLHVYGEWEYPIAPLDTPDMDHLPATKALSQYDAVALFIQRAGAVNREFHITDGNAPAVAEICHRLDGLPLAIELAAARARNLPPEAMLHRLDHRLAFLDSGPRDLPARQQTLRAAIGWSYDLLDEPERRLFRRLAVFIGGWSAATARPVVDFDGEVGIDIAVGLASLVDKSLIRPFDSPVGERRFRMLTVIQAFAEDLSTQDDALRIESKAIRKAHGALFASVLADANRLYKTDPEGMDRGLALLDREIDNIRAALTWAGLLLKTDDAAARTALRMLIDGGPVIFHRVAPGERLSWWTTGRAAARKLGDAEGEGRCLVHIAVALREVGQSDQAIRAASEALDLLRDSSPTIIARAHGELGNLHLQIGDYRQALIYHQAAVDAVADEEDRDSRAVAYLNLGNTHVYLREFEKGIQLLERAHTLARGQTLHEAHLLSSLGYAHASARHFDRAVMFYEKGLDLARRLKDKRTECATLMNLASAHLELKQIVPGLDVSWQAAALAREIPFPRAEGHCVANIGLAQSMLGEHDQAIAAFTSAIEILGPIGDRYAVAVSYYRMAQSQEALGHRAQAAASVRSAIPDFEAVGAPEVPEVRAYLSRLEG